MKVAIKDTTLKIPGVEKPYEWPSLTAPLSPDGDWYVAGQTLPKTWRILNDGIPNERASSQEGT